MRITRMSEMTTSIPRVSVAIKLPPKIRAARHGEKYSPSAIADSLS